jgi:aryl-alcohol dehydrogenase-like predicted oxidoreductase
LIWGRILGKEASPMERTTLGKTGLQVSRLGAGLAEIASLTDASIAGQVLNAALDGGINFLDAAACYRRSEEWIGRTIAHRRDEYILATKAGHVVNGYQGKEWTAQTIRDSIERSLLRTRTDYLDLVQLHSCDVEVLERGEAIQALLDARQAGKTRYVGYSGNLKCALWAIDSGVFDALQITLNVVDQWARWEVLPRAESAGLGIIAKRPIASGAWKAPPGADATLDWYRERIAAIMDMGPIPGAPEDPVLLFLGFTLAHDQVDTAIVGTRDPEHIKANIALVERQLPIPAPVVRELHGRFDRLARQ